ncbi:unnamed protein product [Adineta steineri]|uniref:Uncharacterized protein n=1 Tax=Adineta steineri TaxID=433720 RepID=A0A819YXB2_9BILA|nr:unnamed protein product [Adineta steineri]
MGFFKEDGTVNDFFKNVEQGASTTVYAALAPELDGYAGEYLEDCAINREINVDKTNIKNEAELNKLLHDIVNELDVNLSTTSPPSIATTATGEQSYHAQVNHKQVLREQQYHEQSYIQDHYKQVLHEKQYTQQPFHLQDNHEKLLNDSRYVAILNDLQKPID